MLTIIFIFSLCSIAIMIGFKMIEEKRRAKFFFKEARSRADAAAARIAENAKNHFSVFNGKNGKLLAALIGNAILYGVSKVRRNTRLKKLQFMESLKTNRNLKKKGSASFFLKNVSEYKGKYIK